MDKTLIQNDLGYYEVSNKPSHAELEHYYAEKYYQAPTGQYDTQYSVSDIQFFKNKAVLCLETLRLYEKNINSLYEVGSGEGFFADYFHQQGFEVSLNDFSSAGIEKFHPHLKPFLHAGDAQKQISEFISKNTKYDLISLDNVLEHVLDPKALLSDIKGIMSENSVARITVPNDFSRFQEMLLEQNLITETWVCPPDHLTYFNATNLKEFCKNEGFNVMSLQCDFPIELFLSNPHSHYYNDRSRGKAAHQSRVMCTNYMVQQNMSAYVRMCENAAELEFGRDVTVYLTL